jgi:antitoxin component YwqK of YwqJK toxin-antitoxin module
MKRTLLFVLALIAAGSGHADAQARQNLSDLVQRGDTYLTPGTLEPYNGPVVLMQSPNKVGMWASLRNGKFHGLYELYHPNGQLSFQIMYKDGLKDGLSDTYFENGEPQSKLNYRDGEDHGEHVWYYQNGRLMYRMNFQNGVKHGLEEWYRESGELSRGGINNMGEECGEWISLLRGRQTYPPCPPGLEDGN